MDSLGDIQDTKEASFQKSGDNRYYVIVAIGTGLVLAADLVLPLGYAVGAIYLFPLFATLGTPQRSSPFLVAGIQTLLLMIGALYSPPGASLNVALFNRIVAVLILWITAILIWHVKALRNERLLEAKPGEANGKKQPIESHHPPRSKKSLTP